MSLTVASVWVKGNVDYGVEYVTKLHGMVSRHLSRPYRFVCLTDRPEQLPEGVEGIRIKPHPGLFGWWSKVELFNPQHALTGRVLYLDLDTLVVDALDPIVDYPEAFAAVPHAGTFNGKNGLQVVKRFNSSVMAWDAEKYRYIYNNWVPKVAKRLHGDQDWIGEQNPFGHVMPALWFPRMSEGWPVLPAAKVVLCKKPKNTLAARTLPGFAEAWG